MSLLKIFKQILKKKNLFKLIVLFIPIYLILNEIIKYNKALKVNKELMRIVDYKNYIQSLSKKVLSINYALKYSKDQYEKLPTIYFVTICNFERKFTELADLNRLRNTLLIIPKLTWILVENSKSKSSKLSKFISDSDLNIVHLFKNAAYEHILLNEALFWLRENYEKIDKNGVIYYGNTEGSYDLKLFQEMRFTNKVSVWPIAFSKMSFYQKPICANNKVVSWDCGETCNENELIDIRGFSINLNLVINRPEVNFGQTRPLDFISSLINLNELEPKANNCSKVYVWGTKTYPAIIKYKKNSNYENDILEQI